MVAACVANGCPSRPRGAVGPAVRRWTPRDRDAERGCVSAIATLGLSIIRPVAPFRSTSRVRLGVEGRAGRRRRPAPGCDRCRWLSSPAAGLARFLSVRFHRCTWEDGACPARGHLSANRPDAGRRLSIRARRGLGHQQRLGGPSGTRIRSSFAVPVGVLPPVSFRPLWHHRNASRGRLLRPGRYTRSSASRAVTGACSRSRRQTRQPRLGMTAPVTQPPLNGRLATSPSGKPEDAVEARGPRLVHRLRHDLAPRLPSSGWATRMRSLSPGRRSTSRTCPTAATRSPSASTRWACCTRRQPATTSRSGRSGSSAVAGARRVVVAPVARHHQVRASAPPAT